MHTVEIEVGERKIQLETGRLAKQAGGSVVVSSGDARVLVTATAADSPREGIDFFPLTVDYREYTYAAGRFPGGYIKREARPSEKEVLTSRMIDRPIRPLFADGYKNETQVIALVQSADPDFDPSILAMIGAPAALAISPIPFTTVTAAVRVSQVDGGWLINPSYEAMDRAALSIIVAAAEEGIVMVEAGATSVDEATVLESIRKGHEACRKIINGINELVARAGKPKLEVEPPRVNEELLKELRGKWTEALEAALDTSGQDKLASYAKVSEIKKEAMAAYADDEEKAAGAPKLFDTIKEEIFRDWILKQRRRPDKRALDEIRKVTCEVSELPRVHGSAVFTRGETQALVSATLGTKEDAQRQELIHLPDHEKRFMVHYNFPPFSVGEVQFLRGPGRREIGHGMLAERALTAVIPDFESFPYTIRVVSDILESNGSSSMATVCGGTLALMDAGVPIKAPVAGIAMGLVTEGDDFVVLTDIAGAEDHYGDMDFKVAGTEEGITALQMDIKQPNVSHEVLEKALEQAKKARLELLNTMTTTISAPRGNISPHAPRIQTLQIPKDKIRDLIGPGGKTIKGIVEQTGAKIDVNDDGVVQVASADENALKQALEIIGELTAVPEVGKTYLGKVTKIADFGAFVEIFTGTEGLLHISEIADHRIREVSDELNVGDQILVKCLALEGNRIRLSRRAVLREQRGESGSTEDDRDDGGSRPPQRRAGGRSDRGGRDRGGRGARGRGDRGGRGRGDRGGRDDRGNKEDATPKTQES